MKWLPHGAALLAGLVGCGALLAAVQEAEETKPFGRACVTLAAE